MESLYRKYRPQTFDDVVGQRHVVETLERAVLEGRTSHAYLFCGPRGTGKTTMARLLAKALLCEQGPGHLPDGTCEECQLIAAGEHPDVYELDAASRTGVDNVREEIINRVNYAPARGRYKVYIIDEVHMLTTAAFNALLKTLEEPPEHIVFVLCTTDPQKIPATILSRVQRFDFHSIGRDDIQARLVYVCEQEGFTYDDAALELVVRHARGGMRDALSTLEQLSVFGDGTISLDAAQDLLGEVPGSALCSVAQALAARDVATLFGEVAKLVDAGRDLLQFTRELAAHMRDVYVVAAVGADAGVVEGTSEELEALRGEAASFGSADRVARILAILGDASTEMRVATNQRLVLEIALTRMARPQADVTLDALAERVDDLERQVSLLSRPQVRGAGQGMAAPARASAQGAKMSEAPYEVPVQPANVSRPMPRHEETRQAPEGAVRSQRAAAASSQPETRSSVHPSGASSSHEAPSSGARQQASPDRRSRQQALTREQQVATREQQRPQRTATREASPSRHAPAAAPQATPPSPSAQGPSTQTDASQLQRSWKQVVETLVRTAASRGSLLMNSTIESDDGTTLLVTLPKGSSFALRMLERQDVRSTVDPVVEQVFGRRQVRFAEAGPQESGAVKAARGARAKATAERPAPTQRRASASYQASAPQPLASTSQGTRRPAPAPAATPLDERRRTAAPTYQMPWDEPRQGATSGGAASPSRQVPVAMDYDVVPYDDLSASSYNEDGMMDLPAPASPVAIPPKESPASNQAAQATPPEGGGARRQVAQAASASHAQKEDRAAQARQGGQPAPSRRSRGNGTERGAASAAPSTTEGSVPTAKPQRKPEAAQAKKKSARVPSHKVPDDIPPDLTAIIESAFDVFGDGVEVSTFRSEPEDAYEEDGYGADQGVDPSQDTDGAYDGEDEDDDDE